MNDFTLVDWVLGAEAGWLPRLIGVVLVWAVPITGFISVVGMFSIWLERKVSAHIQCRVGPMEVGPHGALQTLADGVKLLAKEDLVPHGADRVLFMLAPILAFVGAFASFAVVPFGPDLIVADLDLGLFFLMALGSVEAIGVIAAGWASNNKWSVFGSVRAATQVVSYEIPLGIAFVTAAMVAGSLSLIDIVTGQSGMIWNWYVFRNPVMPIVFIIYFIASLAECKRAPFDLAEAETELVSGFHTEYSGMRFAIFFLAEYGAMYLVSAVAAVLFLGGWYTGIGPLDEMVAGSGFLANALGAGVIVTKAFLLVFVQMWLRWTLPRIRLDQMMYLCLKVLTPIAMVCLMIATLWQGLLATSRWVPGTENGFPLLADPWGAVVFVATAVGTWWYVKTTIRNSPSYAATAKVVA